MRTIAIALFVLVATAAARTCPAKPAVDVLRAPTGCVAANACGATMCSCAGGTGSNPWTCFSSLTAAASCTTISTCVKAYTTCLGAIPVSNNLTDPCSAYTLALHSAKIAAYASSDFQSTDFQKACTYAACAIVNASSALTCSFGTNDSAVCPAPAGGQSKVPVMKGTLILGATNWESMVGNLQVNLQLQTSLISDLAGLLGIESVYIQIVSTTATSRQLTVVYNVLAGNGKEVGTNTSTTGLIASAKSGVSNTNWLTVTKVTYARYATDVITVIFSNGEAIATGSVSSASATTVMIAALVALASLLA